MARVSKWFDWEQPEGWTFRYRLENENGTLVVRELRVMVAEGKPVAPGGVPARVLRRFTTKEAIRRARGEAHAFLLGAPAEGQDAVRAKATRRALASYKAMQPFLHGESPVTGRRGHPDLLYARLAEGYVSRLRAGSRTPVKDLADRNHLSRSRIEELIGKARKRGLLTPATSGRAGGTLTPKARQVLAQAEKPRDRRKGKGKR